VIERKGEKEMAKEQKVKVKNMTNADAIPVLAKILEKGDFGKRKRRALELGISALRHQTLRRPVTQTTLRKRGTVPRASAS
jgi:hypothetical protein